MIMYMAQNQDHNICGRLGTCLQISEGEVKVGGGGGGEVDQNMTDW